MPGECPLMPLIGTSNLSTRPQLKCSLSANVFQVLVQFKPGPLSEHSSDRILTPHSLCSSCPDHIPFLCVSLVCIPAFCTRTIFSDSKDFILSHCWKCTDPIYVTLNPILKWWLSILYQVTPWDTANWTTSHFTSCWCILGVSLAFIYLI